MELAKWPPVECTAFGVYGHAGAGGPGSQRTIPARGRGLPISGRRRHGVLVHPSCPCGSRSFRRNLFHDPNDGAAQFCIFDARERAEICRNPCRAVVAGLPDRTDFDKYGDPGDGVICTKVSLLHTVLCLHLTVPAPLPGMHAPVPAQPEMPAPPFADDARPNPVRPPQEGRYGQHPPHSQIER